jgi:hypothetical protein
VAAGILDQAVSELKEHLRAALERGGPWASPPELVLWGGLLQSGGSLRAAMEPAVAPFPVRLSVRDLDPAMGAASLARTSRS